LFFVQFPLIFFLNVQFRKNCYIFKLKYIFLPSLHFVKLMKNIIFNLQYVKVISAVKFDYEIGQLLTHLFLYKQKLLYNFSNFTKFYVFNHIKSPYIYKRKFWHLNKKKNCWISSTSYIILLWNFVFHIRNIRNTICIYWGEHIILLWNEEMK